MAKSLKVWANLKVGDPAIEMCYCGPITRTPCSVVTVGRKWITTSNGNRYKLNTGRGEDLNYRLHTLETLTEQSHRSRILSRLRFFLASRADRIPTDVLDSFDETISKLCD